MGVSLLWVGQTLAPRDMGLKMSKLVQASQAYFISEMMKFIIVQSKAKVCLWGLIKGTFYLLEEAYISSMTEGTMIRPIA